MNTIEEEKVTNIRKELIEKKKKNLFKDVGIFLEVLVLLFFR